MKIKAIVKFGNEQREIIFSCGTGDKSFKWLAIVAAQRFAQNSPNGILRRSEDFHGVSDQAQFYPDSLTFSSGERPHPNEFINEYLKDGDEVFIALRNKIEVDKKTGTASQTKWSNLAYNNNSKGADAENQSQGSSFYESEEDFDISKPNLERDGSGSIANVQANAGFLKIVLSSQMINIKGVIHAMETCWSTINNRIPRLKETDKIQIKQSYAEYWDLLVEFYHTFAPSGDITKESYQSFVEQANIFPMKVSTLQSNTIYTRVCKHLNIENGTSFQISAFLMSLIFCVQLKYNDTFESDSTTKPSYRALQDLLSEHLIPLAKSLHFRSILKYEFCKDECLARIRPYYDQLHNIFDKYAAKSRELPTTVPIEEVTEVIYFAGLMTEKNNHKFTQSLFQGVKSGTILGRAIDEIYESEPVEQLSRLELEDLQMQLNEFTFPEFVEAIARAGYHHFFNNPTKPMTGFSSSNILQSKSSNNLGGFSSNLNAVAIVPENVVPLSIIDSFIKGIVAIVDMSTNTKNPHHNHLLRSLRSGGKSPMYSSSAQRKK